MKKTSKLLWIIAAVYVCASSSCKKDEGNATVLFQFNTINKESSLVKVDSAQLFAKSIAFEGSKKNTSKSYPYDLNRAIDLVRGEQAGNTEVIGGSYSDPRLRIVLSRSNPQNGLYVRGYYTNSSQTSKVELFIFEDLNILSGMSSANFDKGQTKTLNCNLDFSTLFANVSASDWDNAVRSNNTIIIAKDPNYGIYQKIVGQLNAAFKSAL